MVINLNGEVLLQLCFDIDIVLEVSQMYSTVKRIFKHTFTNHCQNIFQIILAVNDPTNAFSLNMFSHIVIVILLFLFYIAIWYCYIAIGNY